LGSRKEKGGGEKKSARAFEKKEGVAGFLVAWEGFRQSYRTNRNRRIEKGNPPRRQRGGPAEKRKSKRGGFVGVLAQTSSFAD